MTPTTLLLVLAACASPAARSTLPSREHGTQRAAPAARVELTAGIDLRPDRLRGARALTIGDAVNITTGGIRLSIEGDRIEVARDVFARKITSYAPCGTGWVFVSEDGVVAHARTFAGELERLATLPPAEWSLRVVGGVVRYEDGERYAFSGACRGPIRAVTPDGDRAVTRFEIGPDFALAVTDDGRLHRQRARDDVWRPIRTASAVERIVARGSELVVRTRGGWFAFGADGEGRADREAPNGSGALEPHSLDESVLDDATTARAIRALVRAHPVVLDSIGWHAEVPRLTGRAWPVRASDGRYVIRRRTGYAMLGPDASIEPIAYEADEHTCYARAWGARAALECDDGSLYRSNANGAFERVVVPLAAGGDRLVLSDDGRHVLHGDACVGTDRSSDPHAGDPRATYCVRDVESGAARSLISAAVATWGPFLHRDAVLFTNGEKAYFGSATDGQIRELGGAAARAAAQNLELGFTSDGAIAGVLRAGEGRVAAFVGDADAELESLPLPDGAVTAGFVDRSFGVAVGASLARLWTTEDGGRHWVPLDPGIDGDPSRIAVEFSCTYWPCPRLLDCDGAGCRIGEVARVLRDAPGDGARVLAAGDLIAHPAAPRPIGSEVGSIECSAGIDYDSELVMARYRVEAARYQGERPDPADEQIATSIERERRAWHTVVTRTGRFYELEWSSRGSSFRSRIDARELDRGRVGAPFCDGLASLPGQLLASCVHRGGDEEDDGSPRLIWADAGGSARVVAIDGAPVERIQTAFEHNGLVHIVAGFDAPRLITLDAAGRAVASHALRERTQYTSGTHRGQRVILEMTGLPYPFTLEQEYRPLALDSLAASDRLEGPLESPVTVCTEPEREGTTTIWMRANATYLDPLSESGHSFSNADVLVEVAPTRSCVRRVRPRMAPEFVAERGTLIATIYGTRAECTLRPIDRDAR